MNFYEIETKYSAGTYAKQELAIVRGQGASLFDADGNEYLDCTSGHGVANLGHAHPKVAAAIAEQASTLITLFETYPNDKRAALMQKMGTLVPGLERVFFCNSGTEAVEAALKFARISTGRTKYCRSYARLSTDGHLVHFLPHSTRNIERAWSHWCRALAIFLTTKSKHSNQPWTDKTAAVILEVIQGEGGVYPADPEYIQVARRICDEKGALLIIDEIQSGFGRTGAMFAVQHFDVMPDMLCCAKSLAGGVPMGAVLIGEKVGNLTPGTHATTFGGNPLSCAAGLAALAAIEEEDLAGQAAEKGAYLMDKLRQIDSPIIREVRGMGLMVGVELKQKVAPYLKALQDRNILALNAGMTVLRLLPPLVISYEQLDRLVVALTDVLTAEDS